jgi:hypothetical protein
VKVEDPALIARIDAILAVYLDPDSRVFWLAPDGGVEVHRQSDVQDRLRALTPSH